MNSRAEIYHVRARTRGPRATTSSGHKWLVINFISRPGFFSFFLNRAHSDLRFMYLTVNARNRATSHAEACENSTCVPTSSRSTRKPRNPWSIATQFSCDASKPYFRHTEFRSGASVTSNAVIVLLWQEFVAWRMIQNRKYLPRVKCTPGSR